MTRGREVALVGFVVAALLGGVGFDLMSDEAGVAETPAAEPIFEQRSVFCPSPPRGGESTMSLVLGAVGAETIPVGTGVQDRVELSGQHTLMMKTETSRDLVGYGGEVLASSLSTFTGKVSGLGAARCSRSASPRWFFAEGSSALGAEQRFVIYNPFPDEAVVGIDLFTPAGPQGNANLSEGIAVPAGETIVVELNEYIRQQRFVAASIVANRGRVIAWRALQVGSEDRPEGVQFSLGATAPSDEWFFPEGAVGDGYDERVSLFNPTDEEAIASVALVTGEQTLQPPKLVEVVVPPQTLQPLPLREYVAGPDRQAGGVGVVVRTTSGRLVAERSVYYESDDLVGVASEVGAARTATEWFVGPSVSSPATDSIVLLNPGAEPVSVSLSLRSPGSDPLEPGVLQELQVKAGTRLKVPLGEWTRGSTYAVVATSDGGIVAERFGSRGSEVGSVMGIPLGAPPATES
ncbi:MAG TPA: DUF5719 family protein [Actinomycetota bacterium]|nr:DUF5719 family protein [Actinomycetota bacterium]